MPAKSKAQLRLMQAVAHNPKFAKKVGIPKKVGEEFSTMKEGGEVKKKFKLFGGVESKAEEFAEKKSVKSKKDYAKKEKSEPGEQKFACGGKVKKMAIGGALQPMPRGGGMGAPQPMPRGGGMGAPQPMPRGGGMGAPQPMQGSMPPPMPRGGGMGAPQPMAAPAMARPAAMPSGDQSVAAPAMARPAPMPSGDQPVAAPGGLSGAYKKGGSVTRGDGCAQRGKTRGKFV